MDSALQKLLEHRLFSNCTRNYNHIFTELIGAIRQFQMFNWPNVSDHELNLILWNLISFSSTLQVPIGQSTNTKVIHKG